MRRCNSFGLLEMVSMFRFKVFGFSQTYVIDEKRSMMESTKALTTPSSNRLRI